jgi:polyhydroxybutyrate depolymerase
MLKRATLVLIAVATASVLGVGALSNPVDGATSSARSVLAPLTSGDHDENLTWRGVVRSFIVHVPTGGVVADRPLILVYHGATDTAANTIGETDFEQAGNRVGDVVVFMQGYDNTWNELTGHTPAEQAHIDDIGFTNAVLNALKPLTEYDAKRVALTGVSNGALMVETLGCRLASRVRLIVPVEGELASAVSPGCSPARPISVYEIHGTADPTIPYNGGSFSGVGGTVSVLSARASVARWAHLDDCVSSTTAAAGQGITLTHYASCHGGVSVTLRTIIGGGHVWGANIGELVTAALGH